MSKATAQFCGDRDYLQRYLQERLNENDESSVIDHIGDCDTCQRVLEQLAAGDAVWDRLGEHLSLASPATSETRDFDHRERWLARLKEYLAPTDDPKMMGRLGGFEVCGLIGVGSTGIVVKAWEPRLNRYVAIKILSPTYSSLGASRKRFEREGRAVAAVANEHVVPIFAVDEHRGLPYIVMQYIPGGSLLQRMQKEGPLDTCEVTRIGLQVANGLAAAHAQGIVHRDVKPANVLLEPTIDRAMVTDFGLARVTDEATMTRSGTIAGTPQYMSPEQARGEGVDHRTDLFSLGSLMYAACTARPPFRAETVYGVINRVCETEPRPIRDINPKIDKWLVAFIDRLMTKRPADRFQTAEDVATILAGELAHLQNPTAVPKPHRDWVLPKPSTTKSTRSRGPLVATALLALLSLGAMGAFLLGPLDLPMLAVDPPRRGDTNVATAASSDEGGKSEQNVAIALAPTPEADALLADNEDAVDLSFDGASEEWRSQEDEWSTNATLGFEHKLQHTFPVADFRGLDVIAGVGDVLVRAGADDEVQMTLMRMVKAESQGKAKQLIKDHRVRAEADGERLVLKTNQRVDGDDGTLQRVLLRISVPADFDLDVRTLEGDATFGALTGNVKVETCDGCIELAHMAGDVDARTLRGGIDMNEGGAGEIKLLADGGDVSVAKLENKAKIFTSGGNVWFRGAESPGDVYVQTSGGDVEVREMLGRVRAFSTDGNIFVTLTKPPTEEAWVAANAGDVLIEFEKQMEWDLAYEGELTVESVEGAANLEDQSKGSVAFNGGGNQVRAESSTGVVALRYVDTEEKSLGGSGPRHLGDNGLGGSGPGSTSYVSSQAKAKMTGPPRAGGLATVALPGKKMDGYTLYLPVSFDEQREKLPVIVFLQGGFGVGGPIERVNQWGMTRLVRDESDLTSERNQLLLDRFIIVSPHITQGQYHSEPQMVQRMLDDLVDHYRADPDRIYLTGLSRGGHGTWGLASELPGRFAAVAPICGDADNLDDVSKLDDIAVWIGHNSEDRIMEFEPTREAIARIEERTDDRFHRVQSMRALRNSDGYLKERLILTSAPTESHDAWSDVYTSAEFYKWLLQQKRGS